MSVVPAIEGRLWFLSHTTIMQRVGHEDVNTTMKIYTHVTANMKKNAVQKLSHEFRDLLNNDFTF